MAYESALFLQRQIVDAKADGRFRPDIVLMLTHPPVFTLGRRGGQDHLKVTESFLRSKGIRLVQTERGGDVTYHGPGQLVMYPILNLRERRMKVVAFVARLEEVMIRILWAWGIDGRRNLPERGVWHGQKKIGSLGIAIRRSISFHGLALNVSLSLTPFGWVNPCGSADVKMCSMESVLGRTVPMDSIRHTARQVLRDLLGAGLAPLQLSDICSILGLPADRFSCNDSGIDAKDGMGFQSVALGVDQRQ